MLNFRQLKSFIVVAEKSSFTKAARELFLTQPAISAQIKSLEESLQIQLIERMDKRVFLTEAGETFLLEAKKLISIYEETIAALDEIKGVKRGKLTIGASTIPGEYILPKYIGAFKDNYPHIDTILNIADTGGVIEQLRERKIDFGIIGAKIKEKDINFQPFLIDELIVITHPDNHLANKEVTVSELLQSPIIFREPTSGTRMVIAKHLKELNVFEKDLKITMELGSTRAVITAVESNLGLSIISKWAAEDALKLNKIKTVNVIDLNIKRPLYIATHKNKYLNHAASCFVDFLHKPFPIGGINV